ncbi:hypothetical protein BDN72DRAFT_881235 [Pluteus cervinus]|uniref:Uncharacterized protein n=1 Tax=Pluteus cervinus TaxID=181527 RepID=A0ACD3AGS2_9AGAR|nr:hypothetical protein BDN72DRAFT_881235 [Pluteus cervinus]
MFILPPEAYLMEGYITTFNPEPLAPVINPPSTILPEINPNSFMMQAMELPVLFLEKQPSKQVAKFPSVVTGRISCSVFFGVGFNGIVTVYFVVGCETGIWVATPNIPETREAGAKPGFPGNWNCFSTSRFSTKYVVMQLEPAKPVQPSRATWFAKPFLARLGCDVHQVYQGRNVTQLTYLADFQTMLILEDGVLLARPVQWLIPNMMSTRDDLPFSRLGKQITLFRVGYYQGYPAIVASKKSGAKSYQAFVFRPILLDGKPVSFLLDNNGNCIADSRSRPIDMFVHDTGLGILYINRLEVYSNSFRDRFRVNHHNVLPIGLDGTLYNHNPSDLLGVFPVAGKFLFCYPSKRES